MTTTTTTPTAAGTITTTTSCLLCFDLWYSPSSGRVQAALSPEARAGLSSRLGAVEDRRLALAGAARAAAQQSVLTAREAASAARDAAAAAAAAASASAGSGAVVTGGEWGEGRLVRARTVFLTAKLSLRLGEMQQLLAGKQAQRAAAQAQLELHEGRERAARLHHEQSVLAAQELRPRDDAEPLALLLRLRAQRNGLLERLCRQVLRLRHPCCGCSRVRVRCREDQEVMARRQRQQARRQQLKAVARELDELNESLQVRTRRVLPCPYSILQTPYSILHTP
jgi:hypothetical protein